MFNERLAAALRHIVSVGFPPKQLAYDLSVDIKTVYGWLGGNGIRGEHLAALIERMPSSFGNMLFAGSNVVIVKPAESLRAAEEAAADHLRVMAMLRETVSRTRSIAKALAADAELAAVEEAGRKQDIRHAVEKLDRGNRPNGRPARHQVGEGMAAGAQLGNGMEMKR